MNVESLTERYNRYAKISDFSLNDSKCVYEFSTNQSKLLSVKDAVDNYLKKICSVENLYPYPYSLLKSSCKTPNGILQPKIETINEYQKFLHNFFSLLKCSLPFGLISSCALPAIRIKSSMEDDDVKTRPYYTGKLHSDSWVGHTCDAILLLHLFGSKTNTVEFYEPLVFNEDFMNTAVSFDDAIQRVKKMKRIGHLKPCKLTIMDHSCLHRTHLDKKTSLRISIDMGIYVGPPDNLPNQSKIMYYKFSDLLKLGKSFNLKTCDSLFSESRNGISISNL